MRVRRFWPGAAMVAAATAAAVGMAGIAQAGPVEWQRVKVPDLGAGGGLSAVDALATEDVWAVGNTGPKGDREGLVRHFDGTAWREVALPDTVGTMSDVRAFAPDDVWTVGGQSAHHFDGATWTTTEVPMPADGNPWLTAVDGVSGDDLWAVGNTGVVGGGPDGYAFLEHFDGSAWTRVDIPVPGGVTQFSAWDVTAVAADDVWVVGSVFTAQAEKPLLAHFDGGKWHVTDLGGLPDGAGTAVAALDGEIWMVGFGGDPADPTDAAPMLLRHDGGEWAPVKTPNQTAWFYSLTTDGRGGLIAGGYTPEGTAILSWDGHRAEIRPGPVTGTYGSVNDLDNVASTTTVWAIGDTGNEPWSAHT